MRPEAAGPRPAPFFAVTMTSDRSRCASVQTSASTASTKRITEIGLET